MGKGRGRGNERSRKKRVARAIFLCSYDLIHAQKPEIPKAGSLSFGSTVCPWHPLPCCVGTSVKYHCSVTKVAGNVAGTFQEIHKPFYKYYENGDGAWGMFPNNNNNGQWECFRG